MPFCLKLNDEMMMMMINTY